jgi:L-glyceraldehyde 3-phosphate reductase
LSQGLLTNKYLREIPNDSRAAKAHGFLKAQDVSPEVRNKIRQLNDIASARGQTLAQMAIAWVLRRPEVTSALIGASRVEQIEDIVGALGNLEFTPAELTQIDQIAPV